MEIGGRADLEVADTKDKSLYMSDCQLAEVEGWAVDPKAAERLWGLSEELVGEKFRSS